MLVGNAGILVTKVLYTKESDAKHFIIVDAGMNDLARPSLYGSYHGVCPVVQQPRPLVNASLVGPICEIRGFPGQGPADAGLSAGGAGGGDERRGLRLFHEFQLQRPAPGGRNLGAGSTNFMLSENGRLTANLPGGSLSRSF